ncbi:putative Ig domain-containing protein [Actinoplanes sp. KI2]|uniref:putative Ig domain-containing protein n=1 Tax=Actinoplanes sp. KI2 TaxID=2983315 RepID=UPI0021D5F973|nr:putative Ig domain-containing protein [Actinoplanes sp. KI2]MCU7729054.1 putative Ig domain-containing protein [Actinoplanes sp. KI2]
MTSVAKPERWRHSAPGRSLTAVFAVGLAAVAAPLPFAASAQAAAPATSQQLEQPTEAAALAAAGSAGQRVKITGLTTETDEAWANPDGSVLWEHRYRPVRVKRAGQWVSVDTTLQLRSDGMVAPRAAAIDVAFSGGGTRPLVELADGKDRIALGSPVGTLPRPRLAGDTATYSEVLPGVDLRLQADVDGYTQTLVVKTRKAAANTKLDKLAYAVTGSGLALKVDKAGNLSVVGTADGASRFTGTAPRMWDANAEAASDEQPQAPSDEVAVPATATATSLVLTPSRTMLNDARAVFPISIVPGFSAARGAWTKVNSKQPDTSYWNSATAALVGTGVLGGTYRSYFTTDTTAAPFAGRRVTAAALNLTKPGTALCKPRKVDLYAVTGAVTAATTWAGQPAWGQRQGSATVDAGRFLLCPAGSVALDATAAVQAAATSGGPLALGVRATDENDRFLPVRFDNAAVLAVTYVPGPRLTDRSTAPATECATGADRPSVDTTTPQLRATYTGGSTPTVAATFEWWAVDGTAPIGSATSDPVKPGTTAAVDVPAKQLAGDNAYKWRVRAGQGNDATSWSSWCEFTVKVAAAVPPALTLNEPGAQRATAGSPVSLLPEATGGTAPYTWTATGLPAGLSIAAATGEISGVPTGAGTATATIVVTDAAARTTSTTVGWTVVVPVPAGLTAEAVDAQTVRLSWADVPQAVGYQVFRDGELVAKIGTWPVFMDWQLESGRSYRYEVRSVDANGVASAVSAPAEVGLDAAPAAPVNYARCGAAAGESGCGYTVSVRADESMPDKAGALTDGVHGVVGDRAAWQGRTGVSVYSQTVDLGSARRITEIDSSWLQAKSDFVVLPPSVSYFTSVDGKTWDRVSYIYRPFVSDKDQVKAYKAIGLDATARYVRVELDGSDVWTMADEIEVRGTDPATLPVPAGLTAEAVDAQTVRLSWADVPQAVGYQVFRDGELVAKIGTWPVFMDWQLESGRSYRYEVRSVDANGVASAVSAPAEVGLDAAPAAPVNYARCGAAAGESGCGYTVSVRADESMPDKAGALTDGVHGVVGDRAAWQGRTGVSVYSQTVDLGSARRITEIDSSWLQAKSDFVVLPPSVSYFTSVDGKTWDRVSYIYRPFVSDKDQVKAYKAIGLDATARYVRVELDGSDVWTMADEIEVRGTE